MLTDTKTPWQLVAALLVLVLAVVGGTLATVPFSAPMGQFWSDAQQFAGTGHIRSVFTPCGYPALIGIGFRAGGTSAVVAVQLLIYATIILAVYKVLRLLAIERTTAAAGSALLALHPDILISIKKIWDTDITASFLILLCAALLVVLRRGLTPSRATIVAILWGLSITVRPNFPALILPIAFAFWFAPVAAHRIRTLLLHTALVLLGTIITVVAVNTVVHGEFFLSQNGTYNFYAGDNAFTERALLASLNAEPSIYPSLLANGFAPDVNVYSPSLRPYYAGHALLFIRQNPILALKLVLLKLGTLLRPDTKIYPLDSLGGAVKGLEALAIPLWFISLVLSRRNPWEVEDWLFVTFAVAYVSPFLLTNADPRFRTPLDILLLTHAMYRIARYARPGHVRSHWSAPA